MEVASLPENGNCLEEPAENFEISADSFYYVTRFYCMTGGALNGYGSGGECHHESRGSARKMALDCVAPPGSGVFVAVLAARKRYAHTTSCRRSGSNTSGDGRHSNSVLGSAPESQSRSRLFYVPILLRDLC